MKETSTIFHISGTNSKNMWSDKLIYLKPTDKQAEIIILGYKITISKTKEKKDGIL